MSEEVLRKLSKLEAHMTELKERVRTIELRLNTINGRVWETGMNTAKLSGKMALTIAIISSCIGGLISLAVRLVS